MQVHLTTIHKKTQSPHGFYHAHVKDKDVTSYNARFKPNILWVAGLLYQNDPPTSPNNNLTIQFIESTYSNDRFSQITIDNKIQKYQPLINSIIAKGWNVDPLIVITT